MWLLLKIYKQKSIESENGEQGKRIERCSILKLLFVQIHISFFIRSGKI